MFLRRLSHGVACSVSTFVLLNGRNHVFSRLGSIILKSFTQTHT